MNDSAKIGVFLCRCGNKVEPYIDLKGVADRIGHEPLVSHCEIMAYPCLRPGIDRMVQVVAQKRLNRLIVAGCEGRLMLKKLEEQMAQLDLKKGQIDMVNLRGHVAAVSTLSPRENGQKAVKLLKASVAEMVTLSPSIQRLARLEGPVMIIGGGVSAFTAAQEMARGGLDFLLQTSTDDPDVILRHLHRTYPGERAYYKYLEGIIRQVLQSPHATLLPAGEPAGLFGVTGDYTLTFADSDGVSRRSYKAGAIIACIDADLKPPTAGFGHDGQTVLCQPEMEEYIWQNGSPKGRVVFWICDYEIDQGQFAQLSARSAWSIGRHIRESLGYSEVTILYNEQMPIPLSAAERALNRQLGISWIPYDNAVRPTPQDGYITFCSLADHVEHEIGWDTLVLSCERTVGGQGLKTAKVLGLVHKPDRFLTGHYAKVRPEMVGREETYLAGSARYPCDLHEALSQGRRAGLKTLEMFKKSMAGELYVPRVVCVVDPDKCVGCGQCQELCDCGGIGIIDGPGGGLPRVVDPMVCTGGGTCAAACPYHALVLQNNSNDQRESRVAALSAQMAADEVVVIGCVWGGLPAADIAGKRGLKYDPRVHILGVPCVGQLDPCVMARAFLEGAPGLILVGCLPEECHHSYGVDHAWSRVNLIKKVLTLSGFDRKRIALAHADLNKPEEFIRTVESFAGLVANLGPIQKTRENLGKLQAMYDLVKYNARVRLLLSSGLRRPWEETYRGDQRYSLEYDRDFSTVLTEEFLQQRLLQVLRKEKRELNLHELASALHEDQKQVMTCLWDLISSGVLDFKHKNSEAFYALNS